MWPRPSSSNLVVGGVAWVPLWLPVAIDARTVEVFVVTTLPNWSSTDTAGLVVKAFAAVRSGRLGGEGQLGGGAGGDGFRLGRGREPGRRGGERRRAGEHVAVVEAPAEDAPAAIVTEVTAVPPWVAANSLVPVELDDRVTVVLDAESARAPVEVWSWTVMGPSEAVLLAAPEVTRS